MARKKIVFIIVEGPSDQDALELLLNNIFDSNRVFVLGVVRTCGTVVELKKPEHAVKIFIM